MQVTAEFTIEFREGYRFRVLPTSDHDGIIDVIHEEFDAYNRKWEEVGRLHLIRVEELTTILLIANKIVEIQGDQPLNRNKNIEQ